MVAIASAEKAVIREANWSDCLETASATGGIQRGLGEEVGDVDEGESEKEDKQPSTGYT
jgi:hypothetical protein